MLYSQTTERNGAIRTLTVELEQGRENAHVSAFPCDWLKKVHMRKRDFLNTTLVLLVRVLHHQQLWSV